MLLRLRWLLCSELTSAVLEPEAVAVHFEDMYVVGEAIEQRAGEALGAEHTGPLIEGQVAGDDDRAALIALSERAARSPARRRSRVCIRQADAAGAADAFRHGLRAVR